MHIHISEIKDIAISNCTNIAQPYLMIQKEKRKMKRKEEKLWAGRDIVGNFIVPLMYT